ncbi:MAG: 2OG-Fe(II) oxygenase [Gammaproteobacteria bacterium]|nr:2OG-Fe(II) oxygenase [Gammaproteobacteria bacterium]NND55037.1 2OG-Fe(II) oxygenase [Gammaproteobacteria bacterium]
MLSKVLRKCREIWRRRHYVWQRWAGARVPPHSVAWLPDGFTVRRLADTGIALVDNFSTAEESVAVIEAARGRLRRSGVYVDGKFQDHDGRISYTASLYGSGYRHPSVLPLMQRAAMLSGLPYTHIEAVYVTRYPEGGLYNEHIDFGPEYSVDRLYTVLLYLNSVPQEQGGATVFPSLGVAAQPVAGRALMWTNKNPDGSGHSENSHTAMPVENGGEKWVIQFWVRAYPMVGSEPELPVPQTRSGLPLESTDDLPDGISRYTANS